MPWVTQDFDHPVAAFDETDKVHQLTPADGIVQDMTARAEPVYPDHVRDAAWKLFHRHQTTPCNTAHESRPILAKQGFANFRVDAVGTDDIGCGRALSASETDLCLLTRLADGDAPHAKVDGIGLQLPHGIGEYRLQVSAVHHDMGRAVPVHRRIAKIEPVPGFASFPMTNFTFRWRDLET